ncbi:hypothetical protein LTR04_000964 [Oleoguttula sp. CCFEE 6159]|nr:hypothetical protein LTR04_000964 [Oleoguttula sp. CCFEE 6159]
MDVQLYVYDLSKGMARQMSRSFLGIQIDAVYHTAVVFGGIEYFFGAGVQTCYPGSTHHGAPMEIISLGTTQLPLEIILEYLESLKEIYTAEPYDLFVHNCNNFSNDFVMFLVGRNIPEHITSLPQTVLNTPFGQMLKPQLDSAMRSITQAPVPPQAVPSTGGTKISTAKSNGSTTATNGAPKTGPAIHPSGGKVHNVSSLSEVDRLLRSASSSCAVIFFTSSTCAPCKIAYPAYDELAAEAGDRAVLIKVDTNIAHDVAQRYNIRATPTFMTFLKGKKEDQWSGANPSQLRGNVRLLIQTAFPPHPHTSLKIPSIQRSNVNPVIYTKVPPLDKLITKLGDAGNDPSVSSIRHFIALRNSEGANEAPLPDLAALGHFMQRATTTLPQECLFAAFDLLRVALVDPRVSGYYAEESQYATILTLLHHVINIPTCPYNLRLVTLHVACNLFSSPLASRTVFEQRSWSSSLVQLVTSSLLDEVHSNVRVAAGTLAINLAGANHRVRMEEQREALAESDQVELAASILEALELENDSKDAVKALTQALGLLVYCAPKDGELVDLCKVMDAAGTVKGKEALGAGDALVREVGRELLGKGL